MHIGGGEGGGQLELLDEAHLLRRRHSLGCQLYNEMHCRVCMVLFEILDPGWGLLIANNTLLKKVGLVALRPHSNGQLGDLYCAIINLVDGACHRIRPFLVLDNRALEASEPRMHLLYSLPAHETAEVGNNISGIVGGYRRAPPRSNALGSIDKDHRQYRHIPLRLNALAILLVVAKQTVIGFLEKKTCQWGQASEDVTCAGRILSSLQTCTELPGRHQQVDVVTANKVLGKPNDGGHQARFAMMVC
mmetsp:Transcript_28242/g.45715  ORF Transcript_28242/g.45715 Transcript_28242/m.45715 type:complete len:247 (-) Transcript_28242:2253-2993(-)